MQKYLLFAKDRPPFSRFVEGKFLNFWTDAHLHGVLRRTSYQEYLKADPAWETILDLDQLSAEKESAGLRKRYALDANLIAPATGSLAWRQRCQCYT